jgi:hypothetical protein
MDASESLPPELPGTRAELVVQNGRLAGARCAVASPLTLIGQAEGCDVRLNVEGVSPLHCGIFADPHGPVLRDLESETGTLVNGERVATHRLADGDLLEVGPFQFAVSLGPPPTAEAPAAGAVSLERETEAVRIQAAAVAAQQAAMLEEEGRLAQRATALSRQEEQLATHLQDRQRQLDEAGEQLRQDRLAFEEECAAARAAAAEERSAAAEALAAARREQEQSAKLREHLRRLRRRLRQRWRKHWSAQEAQTKKREEAVRREQERLRRERERVTAFHLRVNTELELGRVRLREEGQELALAQQAWEETLNLDQAERSRQGQELRARADQVAAAEAALARQQQTLQQRCAELTHEAEALETRVRNQRGRLDVLQREAARHEGALLPAPIPAGPAAAPAEPLPEQVRELAEDLGDQRRCLVEQWERLLQVQNSWQEERSAALAELESSANHLAQREGELRAAERVAEASRQELHRQQAELSRLRGVLEGRQARLYTQETTWQAEKDGLLNEVELRERQLTLRAQRLEEVHRRRNQRRKEELAQFHTALARCDEARRQYSALWQEAEQLREALQQQERTLSGQTLAVERYRLETINQAADSARAEAKIDRLVRRDGARLEAEARDLALERRRLLHERGRLGEQADRLNRREEELLLRQREAAARTDEWETQQAGHAEDEEQRQQELRRLRARHALDERQLRQLREEIERLAHSLIEEGDGLGQPQQAA